MEKKFEYVIDLFNKIYGVKKGEFDIHYGLDGTSKIQIRQGNIKFFEKQEKYDLREVKWKEWNSLFIPFLFDESDEGPILNSSNGNIIINYDIIASAFYFLSNWQELHFEIKNNLFRLPFEESIQYKLKIIDKPIVNYYFDILKQAIERVYPLMLKVSLWRDKPFCTFISHDIDTCESAWLQGGYRALRKGDIATTMKLLVRKVLNNDGWFNFEEILEFERRKNITSTFFFMTRKGKDGNYKNSDYNIGNKKFSKVFQKIREHKSEIGLHGSLGTCLDIDTYTQDIRKFGFPVKGNRFHFLEFDVNSTTDILEEVNIRFDSTMGFAEHYGFRNGICFPFLLYDIKFDRPSKILEIPLVLMDGTLQNTKYMNVQKNEIGDRVMELVREIKKFNGLFTILWHNTHYSSYKYSGWKQIIDEIITICADNNALFLNGSEIYKTYGFDI